MNLWFSAAITRMLSDRGLRTPRDVRATSVATQEGQNSAAYRTQAAWLDIEPDTCSKIMSGALIARPRYRKQRKAKEERH